MNRAMGLRVLSVSLLLAILVPFAVFAQSTTGSISGTITDASGSVLPGVTVTATNTSTGLARTVVTNDAGHYELQLLPPGVYRTAAELSGFQPVHALLNINVGTANTFDVKLKPGVAETVTVTAATPIIETSRSEVSSVVNEKAIQNLPVNGRNFIDFVLTTPGVVRDVRAGDISFAGQRGTLNSMVVDGANNDNTFFGQTVGRTGSGRAPYQFSEDAVKEFQVNSNSYSAEYGRAGGAVINVVTKSGTNDFRGSAFYYYRDKDLNANSYINEINNRPKSPYHFDQYGITGGGPLVKDKHFFFVNADYQRNSTPNLVVLGGGRIPNLPTDAASIAAIKELAPKAGEYPQQLHQDVYLIKTDSELTNTSHLSLRYNRQRFTGVNFENGSITNSVEHTGNSLVFTDSLSAVHDMAIGNSWFNEIRAQGLKDREPGEANSTDPEAQILQGGNTVINIGRNTFSPRETTIKRYQIADTATYIFKNNTVKGGFDYNHDNILNYFPGNFFGSYRFNSLADFGNKTPTSYTQAFPGTGTTGPNTNPNLKETGLFVQDEWRIAPNATINAGLRYDRQQVAQPSVQNPDPQLLAAGYTTNRIPIDGNNFAPRLGFAWTPQSGRTVVRAGYGIFYGRTPSIMYGTAMSNNGINVQTITFTGSQIPTYPNIYPSLPTGVTLPKPTIFVFDQHFQNPGVTQANAGVEHQLGNDYSVGLTYQYVKGDDLPRSRDINEATPVPTTLTVVGGSPVVINKYTTRPFSNFTRVIAFESSARSKYNGLTLDFQRRFTTNWQARIAWTHANVKDNRPDATAVVPFSSGDDAKHASDPLNLDHDYTYGDTDVRDRVVLSAVWSLNDYAKNITNGFAHALAAGWTLSGIVSYQTGQPFSPKVSADLLNDGNPSNDIAPGLLRNSFRLPSQFSLDPRVAKDIGIWGSTRLQLIVEAFNVTNSQNVSAVNTTYYGFAASTNTLTPNAAFRTPTATTGQRIMQLAGKVTF